MIQYRSDIEHAPQQRFGESSSTEQVCHYIEDNPTSSILLGLGMGFGAGLALGCMLRNSRSYFTPDESFAERIGHQVADSLSSALPKGWKSHFRS